MKQNNCDVLVRAALERIRVSVIVGVLDEFKDEMWILAIQGHPSANVAYNRSEIDIGNCVGRQFEHFFVPHFCVLNLQYSENLWCVQGCIILIKFDFVACLVFDDCAQWKAKNRRATNPTVRTLHAIRAVCTRELVALGGFIAFWGGILCWQRGGEVNGEAVEGAPQPCVLAVDQRAAQPVQQDPDAELLACGPDVTNKNVLPDFNEIWFERLSNKGAFIVDGKEEIINPQFFTLNTNFISYTQSHRQHWI